MDITYRAKKKIGEQLMLCIGATQWGYYAVIEIESINTI